MLSYREESLQRDIERIREYVLKMSQHAEKSLQDCLNAYIENNRQLAYAIILRDQLIDEKEKEIDRLCLEFLVRQQPVAGPLRFAYSTIRINLEIERIGDYAESIARQILKLHQNPDYQLKDEITQLANLSISMFHDSIQSFLKQDADQARKIIEVELAADALRSKLNHQLVSLLKKQNCDYDTASPLLTMIRKFERVSDQARNICNEILYMCTGEISKHPGTGTFRILFIDDHNSCRSQMAEAIANSLKEKRFIFGSAGIDPKPIDQPTISFMQSKGIDLSRVSPRAVHQVPNLDHYQVIVALSESVKSVFQIKSPKKVILLEWYTDLIEKAVTEEDKIRAYEETYSFLKSQICDLVKAITGTETSSERAS